MDDHEKIRVNLKSGFWAEGKLRKHPLDPDNLLIVELLLTPQALQVVRDNQDIVEGS